MLISLPEEGLCEALRLGDGEGGFLTTSPEVIWAEYSLKACTVLFTWPS